MAKLLFCNVTLQLSKKKWQGKHFPLEWERWMKYYIRERGEIKIAAWETTAQGEREDNFIMDSFTFSISCDQQKHHTHTPADLDTNRSTLTQHLKPKQIILMSAGYVFDPLSSHDDPCSTLPDSQTKWISCNLTCSALLCTSAILVFYALILQITNCTARDWER